MPDLSTINTDELNCPACEAQPTMLMQECSTDEIDSGAQITCPACGFFVGGANPRQVEAAVRCLWDRLPELERSTS